MFFLHKHVYSCFFFYIILCLWEEQKVTDLSTAFQECIIPFSTSNLFILSTFSLSVHDHPQVLISPLTLNPTEALTALNPSSSITLIFSGNPVLHLLWAFLEAAKLKVTGKKAHRETDWTHFKYMTASGCSAPPANYTSFP